MNPDAIPAIATMTIGSTALLILAIIVILVRSRTPEMKLLLIGIFMAITAAMQANISGVSVNAAQVALSAGLGSATLMKISVILTLFGAGMLLMSRVTPAPPPPAVGTPKEHPHVD
jgi:hypothetical protein